MARRGIAALIVALCLAAAPASAQRTPQCEVPAFSGASSPDGARATMRVVNDGRACGITLYGVPGEKRNPASNGVIVQAPRHGKAAFVGARVEYTPEAGFVGSDAFVADAWATGQSTTPHRLRVRVDVDVVARP